MSDCCDHDTGSGDYFDLGTHHRAITTASPEAQTWFDRGLAWTYGFHHEEAKTCFERAVEADPDCAMAHWGIAYVVGPNYNYAWDDFDPASLSSSLTTAKDARSNAERLAPQASEVEQAMIATLAARYPVTDAAEGDPGWCEGHAAAMRTAYQRFPDDLDVAALFAEALMNVTPWQMWDLPTGLPAEGAHTVECREVLERALATPEARQHPGILHMYLHLMEMSPTPDAASEAADLLRDLVPDAGHLRHMPSHIDVLTGDYRRVIDANQAAYEADQRYVDVAGVMNSYTLYRCHDLHFLVYGAMFLGDRATALDAADRLAAAIPESLLRVESPPMADLLEGFVPIRVHVLIRFGMWDELIAEPLPQDPGLYAATTAVVHYGHGVAASATGRVEEAERERELFRAAAARVPEGRTLFNNTVGDLLAIASEMLDGELLYRRGEYDEAFAALRRSIDLDDHLPYDEPWGWMQPTRHAYGALLLEQGHVEEAAAVYAADLGLDDSLPRALRHPSNVWSLHGYHECLTRLGRQEEAAVVKIHLDAAQALTDVPVLASCACRTVARPGPLSSPT
jgi:tetratricopeptide (TPR) repeat protein